MAQESSWERNQLWLYFFKSRCWKVILWLFTEPKTSLLWLTYNITMSGQRGRERSDPVSTIVQAETWWVYLFKHTYTVYCVHKLKTERYVIALSVQLGRDIGGCFDESFFLHLLQRLPAVNPLIMSTPMTHTDQQQPSCHFSHLSCCSRT